MTTPETHPHHYSPERCLRVTLAAEKLMEVLSSRPSQILNGLVDRPRPGDKQVAREAVNLMLRQIHDLRTMIEVSRPLEMTNGTE